ncbi:MAG: GPW/gp25 family protein [Leptolyngbyaceae cyanobacterium SM1_3_5]|nr:GPW/gp25 family protein [Leptolyngbyaceae cyanobacterium SM1_3_5]
MEFEAEKAFLGVGWAFPPQLQLDGEIALSAYEEDIHQSIHIILGTTPGERVMRPDFGSGLYALVFEPISTTTIELVKFRVEEALIAWEPRIDSITVSVTAMPVLGRLLINIDYRVRSTNTFYNLVYPFYLLEAKPT